MGYAGFAGRVCAILLEASIGPIDRPFACFVLGVYRSYFLFLLTAAEEQGY